MRTNRSKKEQQSAQKEEPAQKSVHRSCGFQAGALCPRCKQGILDYNGMLNLQCPLCGLEIGHGFT
ncbi:MAG: hypothetical protein C4545_07255 [Anaerolineaceae bacterium]|nr:MAG: hypothetical protein C4545_07255 [Anaerolineaceae bacterium]